MEEEGCPAGKQRRSARGPDTGLAASFCSLELYLDSPKQHGMAAFIAMLKKQYFKIPIVYSICSQTE